MKTVLDSPTTVLPPDDRTPLVDALSFIESASGPLELRDSTGKGIEVPPEVRDILMSSIQALQSGSAVSISPMSAVLTTQQAADLLGISRPTFVRILDEGALPHSVSARGTHRRVRLKDVLAFHLSTQARRREILDHLTQDAQNLGLDLVTPELYRDALRDARKRTGQKDSSEVHESPAANLH